MWAEKFQEKIEDINGNNENERLLTKLQGCTTDILEQNLEGSLKEDFELNIRLKASEFWISQEIINEYIKLIKENFPDWIDNKKKIWEKIGMEVFWNPYLWEVQIKDSFLIFSLMKEYPEDYNNLINFLIEIIWSAFSERTWEINPNINTDHKDLESYITDYYRLIKKYWTKNIFDYIKYCKPNASSYTRKWSIIMGRTIYEWINDFREWMSATIQFFEIFWDEPEAWNLFNYLKNNPQKLENLWWKELKTIDLNTENSINFCFRWILEMVKSRPDINPPHLKEQPTEEEKKQWENDWNHIIREYENMLRDYIAKDFENNSENKTFSKIFFTSPINDWVLEDYNVSKDKIQNFSENQVIDYSYKVDKKDSRNNILEKWETEEEIKEKQKKMIKDIEEYVLSHPNEKILVCVEQHWNPDWSSWNGWSKEDWIKLANISPNIKIWSIRCLFWTAYENKDIYNNKSAVSWFSNKSITAAEVTSVINYALEKGVWFNEMELMTRMYYNYSVTPLTENMTYQNWETWEQEVRNIWLASTDRRATEINGIT